MSRSVCIVVLWFVVYSTVVAAYPPPLGEIPLSGDGKGARQEGEITLRDRLNDLLNPAKKDAAPQPDPLEPVRKLRTDILDDIDKKIMPDIATKYGIKFLPLPDLLVVAEEEKAAKDAKDADAEIAKLQEEIGPLVKITNPTAEQQNTLKVKNAALDAAINKKAEATRRAWTLKRDRLLKTIQDNKIKAEVKTKARAELIEHIAKSPL